MSGPAAAVTTIRSALAAARREIDAVDARVLLTAVLRCDPVHLVAHDDEPLTDAQAQEYVTWIARRARGEPVAYLTGQREFYGRRFHVTPAVLIPRPETELLVDVVLPLLRELASPRVLDLGTGSGCIALTLAAECTGARVTGTDRSEDALAVARANAVALDMAERVRWCASDWFDGLGGERYDVIVSNPPYIAEDDAHLREGDLRYEPRAALTPGGDGLDAIRRIVREARRHFASHGALWFEHGHDQGAACRALLAEAGYARIETHRDLAGLERVTGGRWPAS